jgi:hypothetical protein
MKNYKLIICLFIATVFAINKGVSQTKPGSWTELKAYHTVMSATFHPSEEGNLEPIKTRSGELVEAATAWKNSTPPADFNKPTIKEKLNHLYTESIALDKLVKDKKASDKEIKESLVKLHDVFHEIVGACKAENKEEAH